MELTLDNFKEDIDKFKHVITASQGIDEPKVEKLWEQWFAAKAFYLRKWGGAIYELPGTYTFELDAFEKKKRIREFIDTCYWRYNNTALAKFIEFFEDAFYNNITPEDYFYENKKISKGTKIIRAFKHFENDKNVLEDLQNAASRIIQEDKISGTLCFSVHPLDFLSSSENVHNWRSCHSLDGDYRSGNLAYMVDESTFMCYLKSDKESILPNFGEVKWNSKKWRVLMFLSSDMNMLFAGRQYPFNSDSALDIVRKHMLEVTELNYPNDWRKPITDIMHEGERFELHDNYIPVGRKLKSINDLMKEYSPRGGYPLFFNDLTKSSCYTPKYAYRTTRFHNDKFSGLTFDGSKFYIGGAVPCICCGEHEITHSTTMMCNNCECEYGDSVDNGFTYCECCGRRFFEEDGEYVGDSVVCPDCFNNLVRRCDACGEYYYEDDLIYDRELEGYICVYCHNMEEY